MVARASQIAVTLNDGTRYEAELVGTDPKTDLALLKIDTDEALPYSRFGSSESTRVGDWVVAIGNPFGLGGSATTGIVSARGRDIQSGPFDDFLQIDAPINQGNSGGPLFDLDGRVIGVNTAIYSPNGGNVGIGFAIPSEQAEFVINALKTTGRVERGWLGVTIQQVDDDLAEGLGMVEDRGVLVASVVPDSPAERAGLEAGDVIVGIAGDDVEKVKEVTRKVAAVRPNDEIELDIWRGGKQKTIEVAVGHTPDGDSEVGPERGESRGANASGDTSKLGLSLGELTESARRQLQLEDGVAGALVVGVEPGSPAAVRGLERGDVVVMVGQSPTANVGEAAAAIKAARDAGRSNIVLRVLRGGGALFVAIPSD